MSEPAVIREWTTVDKSGWGPGPWQDEPDKIHWIDPATNLDCLMNRGPSGAWCGYVAVADGHPFFEVSYSGCTLRTCTNGYCEHSIDVDVHGGLTYADFCQESADESQGICHVPLPGRPHRVWWLGFDCIHGGDLAPRHAMLERELAARDPEYARIVARIEAFGRADRYRDRAYVKAEVESLARQLARAATPHGQGESER